MGLRFYSLAILTIIAFFDQRFYRYTVVFNIGVNWRVVDVLVVLLLIIFLITPSRKVVFSKNVFWLNTIVIIVLFIFIVATFRGFIKEGTYAIGLGRYSALEFLLLPIIISTLDNYEKIIRLFNIIIITVISSIVVHFVLNLDLIPVLLEANGKGRFLDSYTVDGVATILLICIPCSILKLSSNVKLGLLNKKWVVLFLLIFILIIQIRSIWVATVISILFTILTLFVIKDSISSGNRKRVFAFLTIAAVIFTVSSIVYSNFFTDLVLNRLKFLQGIDGDANAYWRVLAWTSTINETIQNHLLTGSGFVSNMWLDRTGKAVYVWEHNQYVFLFRTTGLLGVSAYFLFLIIIFFSGVKFYFISSDIGKLLLLGLISALIANMVFMLFYMQPVFLIFTVGLILSVANIELWQKKTA